MPEISTSFHKKYYQYTVEYTDPYKEEGYPEAVWSELVYSESQSDASDYSYYEHEEDPAYEEVRVFKSSDDVYYKCSFTNYLNLRQDIFLTEREMHDPYFEDRDLRLED